MIGSKILHYQITEKLGEGGMGVVYKARDEKLHRTVALKFLHPDVVGSAEEQQRLINEARAAASLSHPNICTIYDINEHDGQTFIAMEFVDGMTLRDKVLSERIEVTDALRYAIQVAAGLKQSHDKQQIHRDIKSANIMINTDGQAVIMDFGLARKADQPRADERLSSGGTSAYMSPEQARGEGVDQRTDIWSLGVVLYETLAGQLPFRGDYEQAVIYSILNEEPKPLKELRPNLSDKIICIAERCLRKDPADRFQTLEELITELRRALDDVTGGRRAGVPGSDRAPRSRFVTVPLLVGIALIAMYVIYDSLGVRRAASETRIPIAVTDFVNETDEISLSGLSGMLITSLEQSRRLEVMTRVRMFDVLKTLGREDIDRIDESMGQEICRASDVGALVIPTIRKFGNLYTIDLKVLDTRNNRYIFTTKEEGRGLETIPSMIDEIAARIRIDLDEDVATVEEAPQIGEMTTVDLAAYQAYFKGEEHLNKLEFKKAAEHFAEAIKQDSTFALAYYRLAYTEWWSRGQVEKAIEHVDYASNHIDRIPNKERYLVRALEAGLKEGFEAQVPIYSEMRERYPNDKEMLFGLGDAEFHSENYDSARVHFAKVLQLDPEFERALQHLTWTDMRMDRLDAAHEVAKKWYKVADSDEALNYLVEVEFSMGHLDSAAALLEARTEQEPGNYGLARKLAEIAINRGEVRRAEEILNGAAEEADSPMYKTYALREINAGLMMYQGRYRDAIAGLDEAIKRYTADRDTTGLKWAYLTKAELVAWCEDDGFDQARALLARVEAFPPEREAKQKESLLQSLAATHIVVGDTARAREIMDNEMGHVTPQVREIFAALAGALNGDCANAATQIDSLSEKFGRAGASQLASLYFALGYCQSKSGNDRGAVEALEHVADQEIIRLDFAPWYSFAWYFLGKSYDSLGDSRNAIAAYERFLHLWRNGDKDRQEHREAESRLAALRTASNM